MGGFAAPGFELLSALPRKKTTYIPTPFDRTDFPKEKGSPLEASEAPTLRSSLSSALRAGTSSSPCKGPARAERKAAGRLRVNSLQGKFGFLCFEVSV